MRIEKINDRQVRCMITMQDLEARNITSGELKYGSTKTKALFREVLKSAEEKYDFNRDGLPLMIEAIPTGKEELMLIISAVEDAEELDPHFANFSAEERTEEPTPESNAFTDPDSDSVLFRYAVFRFENMEKVVEFAGKTVMFPGKSRLYRGFAAHEFLLMYERPDQMDTKDFCLFLNHMAEFGDLVPESPLLAAELSEHGTPIMENAHLILAGM